MSEIASESASETVSVSASETVSESARDCRWASESDYRSVWGWGRRGKVSGSGWRSPSGSVKDSRSEWAARPTASASD